MDHGCVRPSLNTTPPETLLQIAKSLPDLCALHHFAIAVPAMYRVMAIYSHELVHAVISARSTTTPQVRDLIWLVVQLRSNGIPADTCSLDKFLERFVRPTMLLHSSPEPRCTPPTPMSCPVSVLVTASRIYQSTHACIDYYMEKLRAVQPRLQQPIDPSFDYDVPSGLYDMMVPRVAAPHRRCLLFHTLFGTTILDRRTGCSARVLEATSLHRIQVCC